ncbi:hypothetical protein ACHAWF_004759 [Thalassiosira exigua]
MAMKSQDDVQRCFASRLRKKSLRQLETQATSGDYDPMDAEREALWNEMDSELRETAPTIDSDKLVGGDGEHGYTGLHRLCSIPRNGPLDPRWQDVQEYLSGISPDDAVTELMFTQKEPFDYTPLHVACFLSPPVELVQQMINLCPESAKFATGNGKDTPLSLACGGFVPAGLDVVDLLVNAYPEARVETNSRDETPLHIHLKTMRTYELDPCPCTIKTLATVDVVNARDIKGHSPLYHLGRAATEAFSFMAKSVRFFSVDGDTGPDFDNFKHSLSVIVSLDPGRDSKTLFLRDLLQLPKNLRNVSFEHKSTRIVINSIVGRGQYIGLLMMDFYVQLVIVIAFSLGCADRFQHRAYTTVTIAGSAYWLLRRFVSAAVVQAILLMSSSIYLRKNGLNLVEEGESGPWRSILITNSVFIWLMMMGIACHTMKGFSVFVHATVQICKKLFNLFLVFAVIFMCFSTMFFFSAVDHGDCNASEDSGEYSGDYCTLDEAMEKVYSLFFGTLEADDFDVSNPTLITLFFFNVIVVILLLNIIIAVMSDCYADVSSQAEAVFWEHRFELIQDVDAVTNCISRLFSCFIDDPIKVQSTQTETQGLSGTRHAWFSRIVHNQKNSFVPKPIANLFTFIIMALWVLVGLCTFGIVWPRHARRKIFAPCVSDHIAEDENLLEVEVEEMKGKYELLEEKNAKLIAENKKLREMLSEFQKNV